jgi:hypothetical protein
VTRGAMGRRFGKRQFCGIAFARQCPNATASSLRPSTATVTKPGLRNVLVPYGNSRGVVDDQSRARFWPTEAREGET